MATSNAGSSDAVDAQLNPPDEPVGEVRPMPERPADDADQAEWVDYAVWWGANRDHVTGNLQSWDPEQGDYVQSKELTREELAELATDLGG